MFGKQVSLNSYFKYGEVAHHWNLPRGRDMVVFNLKNVPKMKCLNFCHMVDGDWYESESIATVVFNNEGGEKIPDEALKRATFDYGRLPDLSLLNPAA